MIIIYFLIALLSTTLGALTGMGGGVVIKPALDMLGSYDSGSISMLSSLTVLAMSTVSLLFLRKSPDRPKPGMAIALAIGAVIGGNIGSMTLGRFLAGSHAGSIVTAVQNGVLAVLIVIVFIYTHIKDRLSSPKLESIAPSAVIGFVLGLLSAFLGIGGGPINVAVIMFLFALPAKSASICSLVIIFFSQASKLGSVAIAGNLLSYDLSMLPAMIGGGVLGGLIGGALHKKVSEKATVALFAGAQVLVFSLCILNICRSLSLFSI